ncbi:uncharacterized protein LOC128553749 [Mercenaria mercenaria]|uniref:uncharacterized protein LOC128553749 n=1 Tax=Mercenaria mercenaria TaxID=6596 RepID=UPI00234EFCCE|nr:uncharacterized protein LOC128553749 [Mercenaria mercenaria]
MTSIIQSVPHQSEGNPDAKIPMPDAEMSTKWNDSVDDHRVNEHHPYNEKNVEKVSRTHIPNDDHDKCAQTQINGNALDIFSKEDDGKFESHAYLFNELSLSVLEPADKDIARSTESSVNGTSSELKGNICEGDETGNTISLESVQNQCQDSECNTITDKGYLETCKEDEGEETRAHSEVSYDGDGKHSSNINSTNIGQISTTEVLGTEKGPVVGEGDDIEETHIAGTKNLSREPQSLRSEKEVAYVEDKTGTYQGEETQAHREVSYDGDRKHSSSINTTKSGQISTTELLGTTKIELIVGEGDDIEETNTENEGEETQAHREVSYDDDRKHSSSINSIRIRQISTTELLGTTQIEAVVGEGDDIEETHTENVGEETQAHGEVSYAVDKKHSSSINTTNMIRTTELLGTTKIESAVGEGNDIEETHTENEGEETQAHSEVSYAVDRKHSSSINSTKIGQIYTTERLGTTKIESVVGEVDDIEEIHIAAVCQAAELKVKLRSSNEDLECPFVQEANTTDERGVSDGNCIPQASDGNSSECRSRVVSPRPLESDINKSNESRDEIPRTVHREIDRKDRRTGAVSVGVEETKNLEKSHLVIDNSTTMTGYENKIDHPEENCIYQCKLCKEAPFPEKSRVIQHLKSSHFGYCYVCLCGREFATKGAPHTCRKDKKQFEAFNTKSKLKGKQAEDEAYKYEKEMAEKYIEVIHRKTRKVKKSNENLNATRKDTEHRKLNEIRGKKKTQKQLKPAQTKTVNECNGLKRKSKCLKKNDSQEEDTFIGKKNKRIREHALLERANEINPETKPSPDPKEDTMSDTRDVEMSPVSVRISDEQLVPEEEQSKNLNVADNVKLVQKHQEGYIQLNVGGTVFQTSKVTLLNNGYSVLSEMMQQNSPVRIQNKCIFIDRDPEHFRFILNFLRNKCEIPQEIYPTERVVLQELLLEAKFYNIEKLITELNKILED